VSLKPPLQRCNGAPHHITNASRCITMQQWVSWCNTKSIRQNTRYVSTNSMGGGQQQLQAGDQSNINMR
jgi:hypothetical protein